MGLCLNFQARQIGRRETARIQTKCSIWLKSTIKIPTGARTPARESVRQRAWQNPRFISGAGIRRTRKLRKELMNSRPIVRLLCSNCRETRKYGINSKEASTQQPKMAKVMSKNKIWFRNYHWIKMKAPQKFKRAGLFSWWSQRSQNLKFLKWIQILR